jgi:hypothetical protein
VEEKRKGQHDHLKMWDRYFVRWLFGYLRSRLPRIYDFVSREGDALAARCSRSVCAITETV